MDSPVLVFELCFQEFSPVQRNVLSGYCRAFASRHLFIKPVAEPGAGPYLFSDGTPLAEKTPHCYWNWGSNSDIEPEADGCAWIWHHGPRTIHVTSESPRMIVLPRNDLFEIRGIDNSPDGWVDYRSRIDIDWSDKRSEVYFRGHFTGPDNLGNSRAQACLMVEHAGLPADVGLLAESTPPELRDQVPIKDPDPVDAMARYQFLLSLWGNHAFNARLYRGLEAGSLVFHQETPTIQLLEHGLFVPGLHYVEVAPDLSDLVDKVDHYLTHPAEARAIAEAGHRKWMETLFVAAPYTISDVTWSLLTTQPNWPLFCETFSLSAGQP
jgi:hypothetical protein